MTLEAPSGDESGASGGRRVFGRTDQCNREAGMVFGPFRWTGRSEDRLRVIRTERNRGVARAFGPRNRANPRNLAPLLRKQHGCSEPPKPDGAGRPSGKPSGSKSGDRGVGRKTGSPIAFGDRQSERRADTISPRCFPTPPTGFLRSRRGSTSPGSSCSPLPARSPPRKRGQTIVTLTFFALVTGVGGGTVRDLLIGAPVFWIHDSRAAGGLPAASRLRSG